MTWNVVAFLDHVKIQFVCNGIEKIQFEGRDAFLTRIPETLLRIQKRENYRVNTPAIPAAQCTISLPKDINPPTAELSLHDIRCVGVPLIVAHLPCKF